MAILSQMRQNLMKIVCSLFVIMILGGCQTNRPSPQKEPSRWLGPSGNGIYPDNGLLKEWPAEGPEILWTYDSLGIGFSSAITHNDYLFTTGMIDSTGYLYKLNLEGDLVYRVPYGTEWTGSYRGTRGSPTVVGDKIYLVSGEGKLICFNSEDGSILWSKEYFTDFGGQNIFYGITESPVVDGDLIYATPGGKDYNVVALNRYTGELVWSCKGEGEVSAYCTPLLIDHNGRKLLITYTASHLLGIDPVSGKLLWSVDVPNEYSVHLWTPIYRDGEIYYPTGNELIVGKLKLSEDGNSVSVVWENLEIQFNISAILVGGYLLESYSDNARLTWRWVDWDSGEEMFFSRDLGPGRSLFADGMLYLYTYKGELALVKPDPKELRIVSQTKVTHGSDLHQAQPTMHNGVLYIRHGKAMIAYELNASEKKVGF
jgi:outer membrane protein assembly factor BamB